MAVRANKFGHREAKKEDNLPFAIIDLDLILIFFLAHSLSKSVTVQK